jgi:hypothetical protein
MPDRTNRNLASGQHVVSGDAVTVIQHEERYDWSRLTHLQVGRYAEYFVKMEFTLYGFDVYTAEVDQHGIDFVVRTGDHRYYDIQVKSVRGFNYVFFQKHHFDLRSNRLAAVVLLLPMQAPQLCLIPSTRWVNPGLLFVDRDFEGLKSKPEWGLNISLRNLQLMEEFSFHRSVQDL